MYILTLLKRAEWIPGTRLGSALLFNDPIFVSKNQPIDDTDKTRCACTHFRDDAMIFISAEEAMEYIRRREGEGVKIAGMFGVIKK